MHDGTEHEPSIQRVNHATLSRTIDRATQDRRRTHLPPSELGGSSMSVTLRTPSRLLLAGVVGSGCRARGVPVRVCADRDRQAAGGTERGVRNSVLRTPRSVRPQRGVAPWGLPRTRQGTPGGTLGLRRAN